MAKGWVDARPTTTSRRGEALTQDQPPKGTLQDLPSLQVQCLRELGIGHLVDPEASQSQAGLFRLPGVPEGPLPAQPSSSRAEPCGC